MIQDILIQYLHPYPDSDYKINSLNHVFFAEEVLQSHLQLYDQYQEDFIKNGRVFEYAITCDSNLLSFLRTDLTYDLLVLKRFPIYQDHIQKYRKLSKKIHAINLFIRSKIEDAVETVDIEQQYQ